MAWLDQVGGERRYVEGETRVGRGEPNNVRLSDPSVSRDHAIIRRAGGSYVISDLGSANGTFVNDERIHVPRSLSPGDRVKLASVEFTFHLNLAEVSSSLASDLHLASSVSQFLTLSGEVDIKSYIEGDLRVVTVLFLDLCGFTALSATMSPEQVTLVINQCFQHLTRTAAHFGGYVDKYMGDAMMVLFGAPQARDDDPERAVRAAIAMQDVLAQFSERLQRRSGIALEMRVGVNTGEVLAGRVGSGEFSAFTVMGDVVNVASRFEVAARVGHILVGETAYRLTRRMIRYSTLPPMPIRGKSGLTSAYEVEGVRADEAVASIDPSVPFVGRETELRLLAELLALNAGLRSAAVVGEAGIGKSRLLATFCNLIASETHAVFVRCPEYEQQTPYAAARAIAGVLADRVGQDRARLVDSEDASLRPRLAETLSGLIRKLAQERTVLVVLDSAEWSDSESTAVLDLAMASLADANVLVITTSRPSHLWPLGAQVVPLLSLSRQECGRLISALLENDPVDPETVDRLFRWSGGSPLVVEDIVGSAVEAGSLQSMDGRWRMTGSVNVAAAYRLRSTVQGSLDNLLAGERDVLRIATVVGPTFTASLLADVLESPSSVPEALGHLVDIGYLVQETGLAEPTYAFRQEMTRAVIHASLPQFERRRMHNRLALALESRYDPVHPDPIGLKQIADHFASAGQAWRAVEYLLRSADLAVAALTPEEAVAHYRATANATAGLTDAHEAARLEVEIQERIGDLLLRDANLAEAQIAFEFAAERAVSEQRRAELQLKLGLTAVRRGDPLHVLEVVDGALELSDLSAATQASAHALAAMGLAAQGNVRAARERAQRAVALASDASDNGTLGLSLFALGRVQFLAGNLVAAAEALRQSVDARQQAGEWAAWAESQVLLGLIQCTLGELRQAEESVRLALAPRTQPGLVSADALVETEWSGRSAATAAEGPDRWNLACAAFVLGRLLVYRGEVSRGHRHLNGALRAGQRAGARELALEARLELAGHPHLTGGSAPTAGSGSPPEALDETIDDLQSVLDEAQALQLGTVACRARISVSTSLFERAGSTAARPSDAAEAFALAREALVGADRLGLELHGAVARRAVGSALTQLGYWSQSTAQFDESASTLEHLGARVELTRTLLTAGLAQRAHAGSATLAEARTKLDRALELADAVGLEGERVAAAAGLQAMGAG